jgi:hypothetical protein
MLFHSPGLCFFKQRSCQATVAKKYVHILSVKETKKKGGRQGKGKKGEVDLPVEVHNY